MPGGGGRREEELRRRRQLRLCQAAKPCAGRDLSSERVRKEKGTEGYLNKALTIICVHETCAYETVGGDSPGAPVKPPDPVGLPPAAAFASPAASSSPATCSTPAASPADHVGHLPATPFASPVTYCSAPAAVSVQSRQDRAGAHRPEDGERDLEGGRRSCSVPDAAMPAAPTAPAMSDAHQAPVSEKRDIDLFSGEDPVSPDRAQLGVDSAPLVDGAVEDLGADGDSVEDPIREDLLRRRRLTLAPRPISALARSRLVASADEAPVHSSDNQLEDEEAPATSAEYGYLFGYPLAMYLGYPAEAEFTGYSCSSITTVDAGGQGFFLPGTWVAV
ncbi:uncharacterized protein [Miscanthus floridulus]|uniref:uncharacterized protein n=1 Tax=Miscanthus floridulus TaxID=154761 RepID=UPI0034591197